MPDSFLTVAEVAELLKLNQQTIRNWIESEALPAVRVGRRVRIRQSDLDRFISSGSTAPSAPDNQLDFASAPDAELLSRTELAQRLDRSLRWVDARAKEGMPLEPPTSAFPHRRFQLA